MDTTLFTPAKHGDYALAEWRLSPGNTLFVVVRVTSVTRDGVVKRVALPVGGGYSLDTSRSRYDRLWIVDKDLSHLFASEASFRTLEEARDAIRKTE